MEDPTIVAFLFTNIMEKTKDMEIKSQMGPIRVRRMAHPIPKVCQTVQILLCQMHMHREVRTVSAEVSEAVCRCRKQLASMRG